MRKNTVNYIVDAVALLVMWVMVFTGLVIRFILPPGSGGHGEGAGRTLWGLGRHDWGDLHYWLALALGGLMIAHLALHWRWVWETTRTLVRRNCVVGQTSPRQRALGGVGLALGLGLALFVLLWVAARQTVSTGHGRRGPGPHGPAGKGPAQNINEPASGEEIRGSMTLADIEILYGVPAHVVRQELNLPADAPGRRVPGTPAT